MKRLYRRLKRLIQFIPIIWRGHDFDYQYAIDLFAFQLERIAKALESPDALGVDSKYRAMRIRTTLKLMERVFDNYYEMEYIDIMQKKYGKLEFYYNKVPLKSNLYSFHSRYGKEGQYTEEEYKRILEEEKELRLKSRIKQQKAEKILWKLIHTHLREWWD